MEFKHKHLFYSALMMSVLVLISCGGPQEQQRGPAIGMEELSAWLTGSFSSTEQASRDTTFFDVCLEMVPIWENRDDGFWLYVEQAISDSQDEPYRQRVYQLLQLNDTTFQSTVYMINEPSRFAGAWKNEDPLEGLTPDSLTIREGCEIIMFPRGDSVFVGGTLGDFCESNLNGATWATSIVRVYPDMLYTWDRGFDEEGNQVWGAVKGGYEFRRVEQEAH
ncbi:MAG: hypothetical protein GF307_12075 [candidate division Zixibacteria bacterium]|nr:hypothetical protein [candidate division Zixibacteria bacterium]